MQTSAVLTDDLMTACERFRVWAPRLPDKQRCYCCGRQVFGDAQYIVTTIYAYIVCPECATDIRARAN